jgi:hypothetical protein
MFQLQAEYKLRWEMYATMLWMDEILCYIKLEVLHIKKFED